MSNNSANLVIDDSYDLQNPINGAEFGPDSTNFSQTNLNVGVFNSKLIGTYTVFPTFTLTGTLANTSANVTSVSSFTNVAIGQYVTGTHVPVGTYIESFNTSTSTIVLSQAATGSGSETLTIQVAPNGVTAALGAGGSLTVSTTYYYRVTALGIQGVYGQASSTSAETTGSNEVSVDPTGGNQTAVLNWTALQGATGYNIYRGTSSGSEDLLVGTVAYSTSTGSVPTTFSDTGFAGTSQSPPASPPNNYVEFSVQSFTDQTGIAVTAGHALSVSVYPSGAGATCKFAPGSSNGISWFLPAAGLTLTVGSAFGYSEPVPSSGVGTATAITGTTKTFRFTNSGSAALTALLNLLVSTQ